MQENLKKAFLVSDNHTILLMLINHFHVFINLFLASINRFLVFIDHFLVFTIHFLIFVNVAFNTLENHL